MTTQTSRDNRNREGLAGKVCVVFGGAQGIGRAIVSAFTAEGASVYVGDLKAVQPEREPPGALVGKHVDATDPRQVEDFLNLVVDERGSVDVLVNNVGIQLPLSVVDAEADDFDRVFRVNVKTAYLASHYVIPHMLRRGSGIIVNISSNGGLIGRPEDPLYTASKHAVIGLTKSMALAYAQHGIRVNAVCPGGIDTPMMRECADSDEQFQRMLPGLAATTPAARLGEAAEVAAAVVFLASDESSFVTGIALPVDGGKTAGVMTADRYRTDYGYATPGGVRG